MTKTLALMILLLAAGALWRYLDNGRLYSGQCRQWMTRWVYRVFLPALVLKVLWHTPISMESVRITITAITGVIAGLALGFAGSRWLHCDRRTCGAMVLACAFPNVTYMGLPVLEATFGPWARRIAIQYDLFATTPLLLTLGILTAAHFSNRRDSTPRPLQELLRVPAIWAAVAGVALQQSGMTAPVVITQVLEGLSKLVTPMMLLAIGLSLNRPRRSDDGQLALLVAVIIQLVLLPALAFVMTALTGLDGNVRQAVILEAAMPVMLLGIVICDRFGLNSAWYARTVTLTTLLSLLTLPLWFSLLQRWV